MDSKTIAAITVFAALTIALNLSPIKIPAPYAPFLIYQIWEIPIVAAALLFGLRVGAAVSVINTLLLLAIFPGELPTGPFYNLAAILSMLFGIYLVHKFPLIRSNSMAISGFIAAVTTVLPIYTSFQLGFFDLTIILIFTQLISGIIFLVTLYSYVQGKTQWNVAPISTITGVIFRVALMTIVNWIFLPFAPPVGFGLPTDVVLAMLPIIGVFNATLALYTIPIGYLVSQAVNSSMKMAGWIRKDEE
ncbi:MAG: hypothetical protein JSV05_05860 [Candidatus Bathyarchaeota archaeon]|nr:MAG: hypothetical protein JSV05_05860 [Candidatus Bathyarchaeota archaeon]